MPVVDKVILTNRSALKNKYGAGWVAIETAVQNLIAKNLTQGMQAKLVYLDDKSTMAGLGGTPVVQADNPKQNKDAADAVAGHFRPSSVLLLGSRDVIPHQDLANPAYGGGSLGFDPDPTACSDLPYACDKPYSQNITDFLNSTRQVGRLPDVTNGSDPSYLVGLLDTARNATSRNPSDYQAYLGLSRYAWAVSTANSLTTVFGNSTTEHLIPAEAWPWGAQLADRSHFINCEGVKGDPDYYGADSHMSRIAVLAAGLPAQVSDGTVVAVECCYAADLYDPNVNMGQLSACYTYLANGAYGFFGSSTSAYGQGHSDDQADLLCTYFLKHVLQGSSQGDAALQARTDYLACHSTLSVYDLKTLAQFNLMGDPSVQPVNPTATAATETTESKRFRKPAVLRSASHPESRQYQGLVAIKRFGMGTKGERDAAILTTPEREFLLLRLGGDPISDPVINDLADRTIRCHGIAYGYTLRITDWIETPIPADP
jgi:hypothetical protein